MNKKVLVTGGAGYIGSNTVNQLIKNGFSVVIVDNLSTGFKELIHPKARFYRCDVLETEEIAFIMEVENIGAVIHFAAKLIVPESLKIPLDYYENNVAGTFSILKACKKVGVKNLIFSSTAAVYGNSFSEPIYETNRVAPINPYGRSKSFSENIIVDCENDFGLKSVILRYFNVAGASDNKFGQRTKTSTHLIKIASEVALGKRDKIQVTGVDYNTSDGTGVRDYVHVEDLANAHVLALKHLLDGGRSDVFNCGYGKGYSVLEVIQAMKQVSGVDFKMEIAPRRGGDPDSLVADSSKIKTILSWIPKNDSLELICKTALDFESSLAN